MEYLPTEAGEYAVHVLCDDEDIEGSPFMAQIVPDDGKTFPHKVISPEQNKIFIFHPYTRTTTPNTVSRE